ncbi:sensory box/GGDEF family protein [Alkalihalophilus pseudofirmus OF4]|uniref:Sensory box/GGDEF family protein n=1 Tax=Alkalihalophilus pseudofirmus (strain ATCC BAA-2126 / JCM 17055 / OF4) TaxID=398511 RepID=D3FXE2_ALKPO|nr:EAL domain-containing protein [Alkalihalophilus pseudofirmus]ADC50653.1 sensory box/GGDEF family protein [Alkalihalophilus pseudofirmus OF4]
MQTLPNQVKKLLDIENALNQTAIVAITDTNGVITFVNDKFCEISKYTSDELIGRTHRIINSGYHDESFFKRMWETIKKGETWKGEIKNKAKDGSHYWVDTAIVPFMNLEGEPYQYVAIRYNITERKALEEKQLQRMIEDPVTGLSNFSHFESKVQQMILMEAEFHLLYINIDHFKGINESLGVYQANQILKLVGDRIKGALNEIEAVISRVHGDEFAIVLPSAAPINQIVDTLHTYFKEPIVHLHHSYYMTLSIGLTAFPALSSNFQELMQSAFYAVNQAKSTGKNTCVSFHQDMNVNINRKLEMKNCMHQSILNKAEMNKMDMNKTDLTKADIKTDQPKDFIMHYQPQVNRKGEIISFEALVRWHSPVFGAVSPAEFIPLAEETGLIVPLGYVLFEEVLKDLSILKKAYGDTIQVGFNLSLKQFFYPPLLKRLKELCNQYGVRSQNIKIEITESISAKSPKEVIHLMKQFRDFGMEIELDDFGTGYSSMQHLKNFPITCLKIDQSFVRDITHCSKTQALVNSMLYLAQELELDVIAEGIETLAQYEYLLQKGCSCFQGYYFGKPQAIQAYNN